jgi:hypothetical protein
MTRTPLLILPPQHPTNRIITQNQDKL